MDPFTPKPVWLSCNCKSNVVNGLSLTPNPQWFMKNLKRDFYKKKRFLKSLVMFKIETRGSMYRHMIYDPAHDPFHDYYAVIC